MRKCNKRFVHLPGGQFDWRLDKKMVTKCLSMVLIVRHSVKLGHEHSVTVSYLPSYCYFFEQSQSFLEPISSPGPSSQLSSLYLQGLSCLSCDACVQEQCIAHERYLCSICLLHFKPLPLVTMHQGPLSFRSALHPGTCLQGMTIYFRPLPERPS